MTQNTTIGYNYYISKYESITVTVDNKEIVDTLENYRILLDNAWDDMDTLEDITSEMCAYEQSDAFNTLTDEQADAWYRDYDKEYDKLCLARIKYDAYNTVIESLTNALRALFEYDCAVFAAEDKAQQA